ncbi:MAG: glycosyltransferase family 39 protein [Candidatus Eisenbacteria bacterium]|nr:glycosyltransferase family 39 protein [Candidatus Eisenbacteria bacterium]
MRSIARDRVLLGILLIAVLLRLVYAFAVFPAIGERLHWKGVDDGYDEIARHVLHGHGFVDRPGDIPNLVTPPGYVYFLAALYFVFGEEVNEGFRIRLVQPFLDGATALLIFLIGMRVFKNRRVALLGSLAWALYPQAIVYNARVAPEVLFVLLLTAMVLFLLRLRSEGRLGDAAAAGILFGLAVLVKEKVLFFPIVLAALVLGLRSLAPARRVLLVLAMFAAAAAVTAPWIARGHRAAGTFVPITLRSGRALNQGMNESFAGADESLVRFFENQPERRWRDLPADSKEREERARESAREENSLVGSALARIVSDPGAFARAFLVKLGAFWYFGQPKVLAGNLLVQVPILLLAIAGYARGWKRFDLLPFLLLTLYMWMIHALTIVRMRYSLPVMPETILVASFFAIRLWERSRAARSPCSAAQSPPRPADPR